ncbi:zinc ABC transporter substrate-binding protein [Labrenzia sp. VG12]|uniref:zinc ABC transporter substrate-binding protein n=1 Tax=Labrenzia sp. VG12 TaxID=2021862 RepID=UPI001FFDE063|nr:zinc ABC transporter substrate-binding protein [Labrenzia sp. VG12]
MASAAGGALLAMSASALADAPSVVTSIKPVHSIAAAVMKGVGEPVILIDGAASPHGFALKPAQASQLQNADVVFWIGPDLSASLEKPISSLAASADIVELINAPGVSHLGIREGANFDAHDHDHGHGDHAEAEHGHDDHEEHADHDDHGHDDDKHAEAEHGHDDHDHEKHADHDDHGHDDDKHAEAELGHDDHDHDHDHDHEKHAEADHDHEGERDAHIWLNPDNGIAIAAQMAATLSKVDPDNAATYQKNAQAFSEQIEALEHDLEHDLEPAAGKAFIVFHDAYHHFEHHFDVEASGSITLSPEALTSAERVDQIRHQIKDLGVTCVFQEPQFDAKLVDVVIEGSDARVGTLDPLGTELQNGPDLYPNLLKGLAASLSSCLGGES